MKATRWILPVVLASGFVLTTSFSTTPAHKPQRPLKLIVLDPGHGGKDPGAVGHSKKSYEKTVVLNVSNKLHDLIVKNTPGIKVMRTREDDRFVGLYDRADLANKHHADLFISIHCNSNTNVTAHGAETYAVGMHMNDAQLDVIMKENSAILLEENHQEKYDGFDPKSPEAYIMFRLTAHSHQRQSLEFAQIVQEKLVAATQRFNRGVKQAGFLVLWRTSMPSVLVEVGFISHPKEEVYLSSNEGQEHMANSLYQSIRKYHGL
ncbi:MAG: N-acetylmuramoyl-L-alanine amidase [Bacteroidetes bacterium]|nr:N-acetylmuramoyl-L-alanine amidase [Bacteroidota bacterium]